MPQEFAHTQSSSQKQDTDEQLNDVSMAAQAEPDAADSGYLTRGAG